VKRREALRFAMASSALLTLGPRSLRAEGKYPEKPIRLVVPFAPGGETDMVGRKWAQKVSPLLAQTILVDNKPGAGGVVGTAEVARAKPDGYTLLSGTTTTQIINPAVTGGAPYDPLKDFQPIAIITIVPTSIVVHPSVPARTLQELVALAKANPGKYSYGSAGQGSITHFTGELFKRQAGGLDILHVPYKGAGPGLQDLIGGHLPIFTPILSAGPLAYHKEGRLRILAVCSEKRVSSAPDIPTAIEAGVPGMVVNVFNGIFAPADTPPNVIGMLHQATMKAMGDEEFQKELRNVGAEPVTDSGPDKAARFIKGEFTRWQPIVKAIGLKAE
jgi:tripartite-type tricarboxylate transporter receptor subunit TctC